jgi:hypothetical protein
VLEEEGICSKFFKELFLEGGGQSWSRWWVHSIAEDFENVETEHISCAEFWILHTLRGEGKFLVLCRVVPQKNFLSPLFHPSLSSLLLLLLLSLSLPTSLSSSLLSPYLSSLSLSLYLTLSSIFFPPFSLPTYPPSISLPTSLSSIFFPSLSLPISSPSLSLYLPLSSSLPLSLFSPILPYSFF